MDPLDLLQAISAGVCLYAGITHLLIGLRSHPRDWLNLSFALVSLLFGIYSIDLFMLHFAFDTRLLSFYVFTDRWGIATIYLSIAALFWFITIYTKARRGLVFWFIESIYILIAILCFVLPYPWIYANSKLTSFLSTNIVVSPWYSVEQVITLLFLVFYFGYQVLRQYRSGEKNQAISLSIALGVFWVTALWDYGIEYGMFKTVFMQQYGFMAFIVIMSLQLSNRVVEAEKETMRLNIELEQRVKDRTTKLEALNVSLQNEVVQREQEHAALQASESSLRAQYQSLPIPTYTWKIQDDDFILVDFNESAADITQGHIKDFIGISATELYPNRPDILADLRRCAQERDKPVAREFEYQFQSINARKYLAVKYAFVPTDLVLVHTEDITDRVLAEQELQNSQQLVQSSLDALSAHIAVIDSDGTILAVNASWREFADQNALAWDDYGVGQNYLKAIDTGFAKAGSTDLEALQGIQEVITGQRENFILEYPCHSPDQERWFIMRVTRFEVDQGTRIVISHNDTTDRRQFELELNKSTHDLGVRVKELNCLYKLSALIEQPGITLNEILQGAAEIFPSGWQYPEVACARIQLENSQFISRNFQETAWKQTSDIFVNGKASGAVEVYYLEEMPESEDGVFLKAERSLINAIAERLGHVIGRFIADEKIRRRINELSALNEIAHIMAVSTDPIDPLGLIAKITLNLFSARAVLFTIPHEDLSKLQALAGYERERGEFSDSERQFPLNEMPLTKNYLIAGKSVFLPDVKNMDMPAVVREPVEAMNLQKILLVPLKTWGKAVGFLVLGFDVPERNINQGEIALAENIASNVAGAIRSNRLAKKAQHAAVDAERQRLARELHDSVTQSIYSLMLLSSGWESMAHQGTLEDPAESFHQLGKVGQQALKEMRLLIHQLRPDILQEVGLVEALQQRLDRVELRANIEPRLVTNGNLVDLPHEIEDQFFIIAQEALNNSLRHAQASAVVVDVSEQNGRVSLTIEDDGRGFKTSQRNHGMGLSNMAERVATIGGEFFIESKIGRGTKVRVAVDLNGKREESR